MGLFDGEIKIKCNNDASCNNCANYRLNASCRQSGNTTIDYSMNDNPHCVHWVRSFKSQIKIFFNRFKKVKLQ